MERARPAVVASLIALLCFFASPIKADEGGATTRPTGQRLRLPGTVSAATVEIRAPTDGTITDVLFKEGQHVQRGELLFQLDNRREMTALALAQAQLESAEASLETARAILAAAKERQNTTVSVTSDVKKAEASVNAAKAQLESSKLDIDEKTLRSPMDGVATNYAVQPGQFVRKGAPLTSVVRTDPMRVEFEVPISLLQAVSQGEDVKIYTGHDADEGPLVGQIDYIAPRVKTSSGTVLVKARVATQGKLLDGMPVTVEIARRR